MFNSCIIPSTKAKHPLCSQEVQFRVKKKLHFDRIFTVLKKAGRNRINNSQFQNINKKVIPLIAIENYCRASERQNVIFEANIVSHANNCCCS